jgi:hypothetical protein
MDLVCTGSPQSLDTVDLNADGISDLVVGGVNPNNIGVLLGRAGPLGTLQDNPIDFGPVRLVGRGDMDKDGWIDLLWRQYDTALFVLRGAGNGTFLGSLTYELIHGDLIAVADFDGNGRLDIGVVAEVDDTLRWHVYRNDLCQ